MGFLEHCGVRVLLYGSRVTVTISFLCLLLRFQSNIVYSYIAYVRTKPKGYPGNSRTTMITFFSHMTPNLKVIQPIAVRQHFYISFPNSNLLPSTMTSLDVPVYMPWSTENYRREPIDSLLLWS